MDVLHQSPNYQNYQKKLPESDWLIALQLTQICTGEIYTKHAIAI